MAQPDTVTRILDTAETLFAERGFAETSLRTITGKAKVNLAAVNYHFGSKNALIQAVFARYLTPFCEQLNQALDELEANAARNPITLEALLQTLADITLGLKLRNKQGLAVFMRLLGLAYTQAQGHLRRYLQVHYGEVFLRFMALLKQATPELPDGERFWRIHFMLGSIIFTMSSLGALRDMAASDFQESASVHSIAQRLIPVLAAGMRAPVPELASLQATAWPSQGPQ